MLRLLWPGLLLLTSPLAAEEIPSPPREFRAAWVASVANIDWPSRKGLPVKQQQVELIAILDRCVELKLNAVILQVRPMCDALYRSELEPWSEYLTGAINKAPDPLYDPLELAVREAHARGLELHAWFNPYRARHPSATSPPENHLIRRRPDLAKPYGKHHWLNPTHPEVQNHSLEVMLDVVKRYDVDGIHIDDYFYPYKEKGADGKLISFPDDDTWAAYQLTRGKLAREDWRRDAVNRFIQRMYREVKAIKPWVKVGISPFGIGRPGSPPGIAGFDQYTELYADARLWWNEGWCDYYAPQLYWPIRQEKQSFPKLLAWWASENKRQRHLWVGQYTSRVTGEDKGWPAREIAEQIEVVRKQPGAGGTIHFSMKALLNNTGKVADELKTVYTEPALVPASPWLASSTPRCPQMRWTEASGKPILELTPAGKEPIRLYVLRVQQGERWTMRLLPATGERVRVPFDKRPERIVLTAIDRVGQESEPSNLTR